MTSRHVSCPTFAVDAAAYAGVMSVGSRRADRIVTVPNAISLARLACVPVFLWLLLGSDDRIAAVVLLAALGATDWVDGYVARQFHQGSELGKVLDPTADRVLLGAAVIGLLAAGSVPVWVGVLVLAREIAIAVAVLALAVAGARRINVQWAGKAGTLALMFALPGFLLVDSIGPSTGRDLLTLVTWMFTVGGLLLGYYAACTYVPLARAALHEGRAARHGELA